MCLEFCWCLERLVVVTNISVCAGMLMMGKDDEKFEFGGFWVFGLWVMQD